MLVCVKEYRGQLSITKVIIEKETEKQYKLKNTGRAILNKSDLNKFLAYGELYCDIKDFKELMKVRLQTRIERSQEQLDSLQETLNNLKYEQAMLDDYAECPDCNKIEILDALSRDNEREICSTCANHEAMKSL